MNISTLPALNKRITLFAGHYGGGKTTVALNYALGLRAADPRLPIVLCDLDIVNPYYRAADGADFLLENNITLIASEMANTNVESPGFPPQARAVFDDRTLRAVIDVGGDDRGALALGRFAALLNAEGNYDMLLVINRYRPLTRDISSLTAIKNEIEAAAGVKFTGLVNNSNLGADTSPGDVTASIGYAKNAAEVLSLPLVMTTVKSPVAEACAEIFAEQGLFLYRMNFTPRGVWNEG